MSAPAERIIVTILGCGSSGGVPRIGNDWGACDPANPKNRRLRCSLLIEGRSAGSDGVTRILIDTGCDLRQQLLSAGVGAVDAVFYTHAHADHIHGIDDLRVMAISSKRRIPVYYSAETGARLHEAFGYCFETPPGSAYPPILDSHVISVGEPVTIDGQGGSLTLMPFDQLHGDINSFGYRIDGLAYSPDISDLPEASIAQLADLDIWIVDALRYRPHPSHFSVDDALRWIARLAPRQAVLTNLHVDLDYVTLDRDTPANVTPAYDGMTIEISGERAALAKDRQTRTA